MAIRFRRVVLAAVLCAAFPPRAFPDDPRIYQRNVLPCFQAEFRFFELLKLPPGPREYVNPYAINVTPQWNVAQLMEYFTDERIFYEDKGDFYGERVITQAEIREALTKKSGPVFTIFALLASTYSVPYKQYSELTFAHKDDGTVLVTMPSSHKVTFRVSGNRRVVIRIEYWTERG